MSIHSKTFLVTFFVGFIQGTLHPAQFGDFTYVDQGAYIEITDYPEDAIGQVIIPNTINSKPVVVIGAESFERCTRITNVVIPEGVTQIGDEAFSVCWNMTDITLPSTLEVIGNRAFHFTDLSHVTLPEGVISIGDEAFDFSTLLESISLPSTLQSIGTGAFTHTSLTSITIPNQVTEIREETFYFCTKLESIDFGSSNITSIGAYAFSYTKLSSTALPESVLSIGERAFSGCNQLSVALISAGISSIGEAPFADCSNLADINVDENNAAYKDVDGVLFDISGQTLISYPPAKLGTTYLLPTGTLEISPYAFADNPHIEGVVFPDSLTSIRDAAFRQCSSLSRVLIPPAVNVIGESVFAFCTNLSEISVESGNTDFISDNGVLLNSNQTVLVAYPAAKTTTSYVAPSTLREVYNDAFANNIYLQSIDLPDSMNSIGRGAFRGCSALKVITIPDGISEIQALTFAQCTELSEVTLPETITTIGFIAFQQCTSLTSLTLPTSLAEEDSTAFESCHNLSSLYYLGDAPIIWGLRMGYSPTRYYFADNSGFSGFPWSQYEMVNMGTRSDAKIWLIENDLDYQTDVYSELDAIGRPLLVPYALNLEANQASQLNAVANGNTLQYRFYAARTELSYSVQSDIQLDGAWDGDEFEVSAMDADGYKTVSINTEESPMQFIKINIDLIE